MQLYMCTLKQSMPAWLCQLHALQIWYPHTHPTPPPHPKCPIGKGLEDQLDTAPAATLHKEAFRDLVLIIPIFSPPHKAATDNLHKLHIYTA
jgi:hypothetical protein